MVDHFLGLSSGLPHHLSYQYQPSVENLEWTVRKVSFSCSHETRLFPVKETDQNPREPAVRWAKEMISKGM